MWGLKPNNGVCLCFPLLAKMEGDNSTHLVPRGIVERSKGDDIRLGRKKLSCVVDVSMLKLYMVM